MTTQAITWIFLFFSIAVNIAQAVLAWFKQKDDHDLGLKRIELEKQQSESQFSLKKQELLTNKSIKESEQQFKLDLKKQDENIYIHREFLPKIQKVFIEYVELTNSELRNPNGFNGFSDEQHRREMIVRLYCPGIGEKIDLLNDPGYPGKNYTKEQFMLEILNSDVIPAMTEYMQKLPK